MSDREARPRLEEQEEKEAEEEEEADEEEEDEEEQKEEEEKKEETDKTERRLQKLLKDYFKSLKFQKSAAAQSKTRETFFHAK